MRQLLRYSFDISLKNWSTLLLFDIAYKAFGYSIIYSITSDLLSLILKASDVPYLSAENWYVVLQSFPAVLLCLLLVFVTTFSVFFETVAFYVYCESGWQQKQISIGKLLKQTLYRCRKLLKVQNLMLFSGFLLTSILTVLPFAPYVLQWLRIPEFIMDYIKQNPFLFSLYVIIAVLCNVICFLFLFSLPGALFHDRPIKTAWREGLRLLNKRKTAAAFRLLGAFIVFGIVASLLLGLAAMGLVYFTKSAEPAAELISTFSLSFYRAIPAVLFVVGSLATIWLFAVLITLFHQYRGDERPANGSSADTDSNEEAFKNGCSEDTVIRRFWVKVGAGRLGTVRSIFKKFSFNRPIVRRCLASAPGRFLKQIIMILLAIFIILIFSESELGGTLLNRTYVNPLVVAHRAGVTAAPENTMAGLEHSIALGADMVEIDVQQLQDGEIVLLHDDSFYRTTGHDKKVWEVGYDQVKTYDNGSWFSPEFAGEPVPRLEDILKRAKGNIQVMIEIKLTGHETDVIEQVAGLIERCDMFDQASIGSLNLEVLKKVKTIDPKIETVYITPLIFSKQYHIDFIDAFSVETTSVSREMVFAVHDQGKKVYGWTANSKETIEKNLRCQVDGIVTDDPELVQHYTMKTWENQLLNLFIKLFFEENHDLQ